MVINEGKKKVAKFSYLDKKLNIKLKIKINCKCFLA